MRSEVPSPTPPHKGEGLHEQALPLREMSGRKEGVWRGAPSNAVFPFARGQLTVALQHLQRLNHVTIPTVPAHAYNPLASVAGVFRETFAGRREPALSSEP